jgi:hypothetical protein
MTGTLPWLACPAHSGGAIATASTAAATTSSCRDQDMRKQHLVRSRDLSDTDFTDFSPSIQSVNCMAKPRVAFNPSGRTTRANLPTISLIVH